MSDLDYEWEDPADDVPDYAEPAHDSGPARTPLEQRLEQLSHHVRLVARKLSHALFVCGIQGGLGKSRTILHTLCEEEIEPTLINSHITPLALYSLLYRHRHEEVLLFDDVDSVFRSTPHLAILRTALWGHPRIVGYGSSRLPHNLPSSFETTARFIFVANRIPKRRTDFEAVLSRCDVFELSATNEKIVEMMRSIAANGFRGVPSFDANWVINFIEEHAGDRQLSLRLLAPAIRKLKYSREAAIDFRLLVLSQINPLSRKKEATKKYDERNSDLRSLEQVIQQFPSSVHQQKESWCKMTGKSRASFYRALARSKKRSHKPSSARWV